MEILKIKYKDIETMIEIENNSISQKNVDEFIDIIDISTKEVFGKPTTQVNIKTITGMVFSESSTCVDPANYSEDIGAEMLINSIKEKIWFGLGMLLSIAQGCDK